ncbi:helix-turn-helix transcriptional regulator [Burkholderia sp. FERM BP-3421]|jgi:DNA-binding HxlR family transcriptional regulator|uniref:winged helix-turn-helix transcriptional regulator n=1 Tax=Burkholderia sp. FERM BP-3421 TaxID=1494466 RepID=UPI002362D428|nr:helix-turn-helix domain-containing protein [Burkholderia sp. FERM BP-3421]WDD93167.1 helix-turn-helix transcriptional regulator [Burkholderia sp. FERM BP-3421]
MRPKRLDSKSGCAVEVTLSVIGGLWKPVILFHLLEEKKRFMELTRLLPNTTQRMLTLQLRELEADGIVARHVYPQVPPKVEYELTEFGRTLAPVLISLREWGESYRAHGLGEGSGEAAGEALRAGERTVRKKREARPKAAV